MNCEIKLLIFFLGNMVHVMGQSVKDPLFDDQRPLNVAVTLSIKALKNTKGDSIYLSHVLYYSDSAGHSDSIKVGLKGRGNFRLEQCYFLPLWIKINKNVAKGSPFEGNKKLKLVLPCENQKEKDILILREFLCYKLCEETTPYAFKSRLVNIDITELRGNKTRNFQTKGILVEDLDKFAKRFNAKTLKDLKVSPSAFHDTSGLRFDLFQLMIANTDWSKSFQHNAKVIYKSPYYIPVPYDFDMSGLVDASYSIVSAIGDEELPISSVRERYYRGHCQPKELTEYIRKEFIGKKDRFLSIPDALKNELPDREITDIKGYLKDYFQILEDNYRFETEVVERCRALN